jgi:hypothetical protein
VIKNWVLDGQQGNRMTVDWLMKWSAILAVPMAIFVSSCMDTEKIEYTALSSCLNESAEKSQADSSGTTVIKTVPWNAYEVCEDSLQEVVVTIRSFGEHQTQLNRSNVYKSNGVMRIRIGGPFREENEIRILESGKKVFEIHFLRPA